MEKSKPFTTPTLSHDEKEDHARKKANIVAGSSRRKRWRFPTSWWRSTPILRASSGGPQLTFSSMKMLSQVCTLYDANLNTLLMLLLSAFTAFNEEHFKQALERLDYVFAKYIFKVTSSQILFHEYKIKLKRLPWNYISVHLKGNITFSERDFRHKLRSVRTCGMCV